MATEAEDQPIELTTPEELLERAQDLSRRAQRLNAARGHVLDARQALEAIDATQAIARLTAEAEKLNAARLEALAAETQARELAETRRRRANALAEAARARLESERAAARAEQFDVAAQAAEARAATLGG